MSRGIVVFFVAACCGAMLTSGCAKKEIVKSEEPVVAAKPVESAPAKAPAEPEMTPQPVKEAAIAKEEPVKAVEPAAAEASLEKIYFDFDSFILSPAARETLKKNAAYLLNENKSVKIRIEGNCDERGSDEYNLALGEKRAKAALDYLTTLGVPADRLAFISYGKEKPADPDHDEAAWAKNRRDEFIVMK
jgi:peptidoglycan-associated lipoprotein